MEKTTTSKYEDSSVSSDSSIFLTEAPSTSSTRDDFVTLEPVTISSITVTEGLHETETQGTEVYLSTGRSIHDGEITKEPGDYDQTTKIHLPVSSRIDDVTEYTTSSR